MQVNHCQIFFVTYSLVLMTIWNSFFPLLTSLISIHFSSFPFFYYIQHCSLVCTMFFHLCDHFFFLASMLFCVLNSTYGFSLCDWLNSNTQYNFLTSILAKFFDNKTHFFFFINKKGTNFLTFLKGILWRLAIITWYLDNIFFFDFYFI